MRNYRMLASVVAAIAVYSPAHAQFERSEKMVRWRTVASGVYSKETRQSIRDIADEFTLDNFWGNVVQPTGNRPKIDFAKDRLVVIFMGERKTGGFSVQVTNVTTPGGTSATLHTRGMTPAQGMATTSVLTAPWTMIAVDRSVSDFRLLYSEVEAPPVGSGVNGSFFPNYAWGYLNGVFGPDGECGGRVFGNVDDCMGWYQRRRVDCGYDFARHNWLEGRVALLVAAPSRGFSILGTTLVPLGNGGYVGIILESSRVTRVDSRTQYLNYRVGPDATSMSAIRVQAARDVVVAEASVPNSQLPRITRVGGLDDLKMFSPNAVAAFNELAPRRRLWRVEIPTGHGFFGVSRNRNSVTVMVTAPTMGLVGNVLPNRRYVLLNLPENEQVNQYQTIPGASVSKGLFSAK